LNIVLKSYLPSVHEWATKSKKPAGIRKYSGFYYTMYDKIGDLMSFEYQYARESFSGDSPGNFTYVAECD